MTKVIESAREKSILLETRPYTAEELLAECKSTAGEAYGVWLRDALIRDGDVRFYRAGQLYPYPGRCPDEFYLPTFKAGTVPERHRRRYDFVVDKIRIEIPDMYKSKSGRWLSLRSPLQWNFRLSKMFRWFQEGCPRRVDDRERVEQIPVGEPEFFPLDRCLVDLGFMEIYLTYIRERASKINPTDFDKGLHALAWEYDIKPYPDETRESLELRVVREVVSEHRMGLGIYTLPGDKPTAYVSIGSMYLLVKKAIREVVVPTHAGVLRWATNLIKGKGVYLRSRELIVYYTPEVWREFRDKRYQEKLFKRLMECVLAQKKYPHPDSIRFKQTRLDDIMDVELKGEHTKGEKKALGGWAHPSYKHDYGETAQFEIVELPKEIHIDDGVWHEYEWIFDDKIDTIEFDEMDADETRLVSADAYGTLLDKQKDGKLCQEGRIDVLECLGRRGTRWKEMIE